MRTALRLYVRLVIVTVGLGLLANTATASSLVFRYDEVHVWGPEISFSDPFTTTSTTTWKSNRDNWYIDYSQLTPGNDNTALLAWLDEPGYSSQIAGSPRWKDYRVEATIYCTITTPAISTRHGICARLKGATAYSHHFYLLAYDSGTQNLVLENYYAKPWSPELLASVATQIQAPGWHTIALDVRGDILSAFWDGQKLLAVTDPTHQKGRIGLYQSCGSDQSFHPELEREEMESRVAANPHSLEAVDARYEYASRLHHHLAPLHQCPDYQAVIAAYQDVVSEVPGAPRSRKAKLRIAELKNEMRTIGFRDNMTIYDSEKVMVKKARESNLLQQPLWIDDFTATSSLVRWHPHNNATLFIMADTSSPSPDHGVLRLGSTDGSWSAATAGDDGWEDYTVTAVVKLHYIGGTRAFWQGLCARVTAMSEYNRQCYLYVYDGSDGQLRLENYNGPYEARKVLATTLSGVTETGWHTLTMDLSGETIACFFDGNEVFHVTDSTHTNGKAGLYQMTALAASANDRLAAFQEVIDAYPGSSEAREAYVKRAIVRQSLRGKARDLALQDLQDFLAQNQSDDALTCRAQCNLAGLVLEQAYDKKTTYQAAISECDKVLAMTNGCSEEYATAWLMKAEALYQLQHYDESLSCSGKVLTDYFFFRHQCIMAQFYTALCDLALQNLDEARTAFQSVIDDYTDDDNWPYNNLRATARLYLANIALRSEATNDAIHYLLDIVRLYPDSQDAGKARALLRTLGREEAD
jgi:tetratricopeptide (TPR) repeat protein